MCYLNLIRAFKIHDDIGIVLTDRNLYLYNTIEELIDSSFLSIDGRIVTITNVKNIWIFFKTDLIVEYDQMIYILKYFINKKVNIEHYYTIRFDN